MQFCYFGGPNSFLPSVVWSCNTRKILNRKGRTISGTPEKQKRKEGRTQKEPPQNAANFALPLSTFLPSVFVFPAWRKSSYPAGWEHFVSWTIKKLKERRNLGLQNSKISHEIWNLMRQAFSDQISYAICVSHFLGFQKCNLCAQKSPLSCPKCQGREEFCLKFAFVQKKKKQTW